jgi:hypothetical protein
MRNQMDASPGCKIVQTGWNAYSRIDCVEGLPNSFARLYIDSTPGRASAVGTANSKACRTCAARIGRFRFD